MSSGMITKIWGPPMWRALDSIAFMYPDNPSQEEKINYMQYFYSLQFVLPCPACRESYSKFIKSGTTKLDIGTMKNKTTLTKWLYNVHQAVNKKLGVEYGISYQDYVDKNNAYIVDCSQEEKPESIAYKTADKRECVIVAKELADKFLPLIKERGITDTMPDNREQRDKECFEIIKSMRLKSIPAIETSGKYKGQPTVEELKLLARRCSTMSIPELIQLSHFL